jgi:hypothetical protein
VVASRVGAEGQVHLLTSNNIDDVFHYAPLHYLLFIARSRALLSKDELLRRGFTQLHFRSTSRRVDTLRGFSNYVHLTLTEVPKILKAKLAAGFPHFELRVPAAHIDERSFHLCCFNIAKSRFIRTGKKPPVESPSNGRYHRGKELPTAGSAAECAALLQANLGVRMIEVLLLSCLPLPDNTKLVFFHDSDQKTAEHLLRSLNVPWLMSRGATCYQPSHQYVNSVHEFLERAENEPEWRGNGLDFDLLR